MSTPENNHKSWRFLSNHTQVLLCIQRDPNGYYTPLTFKESWKPGVYRLQVLGVAGGHREPLETYSIHIMP